MDKREIERRERQVQRLAQGETRTHQRLIGVRDEVSALMHHLNRLTLPRPALRRKASNVYPFPEATMNRLAQFRPRRQTETAQDMRDERERRLARMERDLAERERQVSLREQRAQEQEDRDREAQRNELAIQQLREAEGDSSVDRDRSVGRTRPLTTSRHRSSTVTTSPAERFKTYRCRRTR